MRKSSLSAILPTVCQVLQRYDFADRFRFIITFSYSIADRRAGRNRTLLLQFMQMQAKINKALLDQATAERFVPTHKAFSVE